MRGENCWFTDQAVRIRKLDKCEGNQQRLVAGILCSGRRPKWDLVKLNSGKSLNSINGKEIYYPVGTGSLITFATPCKEPGSGDCFRFQVTLPRKYEKRGNKNGES